SGEAVILRLYYCHCRMLLRDDGARRNARGGPGNHAGSGRVFSAYSCGGFVHNQVSDGGFRVSLNMAAPPAAIEQHLPSQPDAAANAVVFENVSIAFEDKPVLDGISFRLPKGETKAIFGVAGSGKTTILKLTLGLLKPDAGHIFVLGDDVTQMKEDALFELRRRIGMVFQESALFDSLSVRDNVAYRLLEEGNASDE